MLSDEQLDQLLHSADPARTPLNAGLTPAALALRTEITSGQRRRRGPRQRIRHWSRAAVSIAATIALLGGGTIAVAGDGRETPWGWIADNVFTVPQQDGEVCFQGLVVRFEGVADDSEIVEDARAILSGIDLATLDTAATRAEVEREYGSAVDLDNRPAPIELSESELQQTAIRWAAADILFAGLAARGYEMNPNPISLSTRSTGCE